ncbi:hypothetical protein GCM10028822_00360 [Hymenobacter terrigena]
MAAVNLTSAIVEALAGNERASMPGNYAAATGTYKPNPAPASRPSSAASVNYVHHTRAAHRKLLAEPACRPHHMSLYMALFHQWNNERFPKSLRIERPLLMQEARIGSKNTYSAALRELEAWGLIGYYPTRNSNEGSRIAIVELGGEVSPEVDHPTASRMPTSGPSGGKPHGPEVSQPVGPKVGHLSSSVSPDVGHHSLLYKTSTTKPVQGNGTGGATQKKKEGVAGPELVKNASRPSGGTHSSRIRDAASAQASGVSSTAEKGKVPAPDVPFDRSEVAGLAAFCAAFAGTDYELADLAFYHELVGSWRDKKTGEAPRRKDWVATAKRFMLNDARDNRLKLAPNVQQHSGGPSHSPNSSTGYRSSRFD